MQSFKYIYPSQLWTHSLASTPEFQYCSFVQLVGEHILAWPKICLKNIIINKKPNLDPKQRYPNLWKLFLICILTVFFLALH